MATVMCNIRRGFGTANVVGCGWFCTGRRVVRLPWTVQLVTATVPFPTVRFGADKSLAIADPRKWSRCVKTPACVSARKGV